MIIDLHCHVLPSIDDGAKNLDTALEMCRIAQQDGTNSIIATPHYIHGAINNTSRIVHDKVAELNNYLREQDIDICIYPGCEAFICPELPQLVSAGQVCTLNDSRYILVELPMTSVPEYTIDVFYRLILNGYIPIIAHPERNAVIAKNPEVLFDLIERGALSQVNSSSIKGLFGKEIMNTAIDLLNHNMVHFLASDAHTTGGRSPKLTSAMSIIRDKIGAYALDRIIENAQIVLNGGEVEIDEPLMIRKTHSANGIFKKIISSLISWR
jgi:protein-tyrosine phosphatase